MKKIRLDKYLADAGAGTRSEVKIHIKKGLVSVNGAVVKTPDMKIGPDTDTVEYAGKRLNYNEFHYYMLNKPAGVISAAHDSKDRTVLDILKGAPGRDMFPVGRLDKDTEGLLIITDDGALAHELLSPKKHVDKTYFLTVKGTVSAEDVRLLSEGVDIGDEKPALPAVARIIKYEPEENETHMLLTVTEGRFHQVKRMMEAVGKPVTYLKRISMGSLALDESLLPGEYRELTSDEVGKLKKKQ